MKKHILVLVIVLSMLISLQLGGTVSAKALPSPYRDISLAQEHVEFNRIGDIKTLRVYILGQNISHYEVEWASSDEQVVEVLNDNTGSVNISSLYANEYTDIEAVGDGQATITAKVSIWESGSGVAGVATSSNSNAVGSEMEEVYEFECDVTVDTSASGVVITTKEIVITSKKKAYPIGYLNYTDTSDSLLSFISENDDIAYTANTRSVSGRHNGEVTVVLKTPDGV